MSARRSLKGGEKDGGVRATARAHVNAAKVALGERGLVWWADGAPDYNRKLIENTPYGAWFASTESEHVDD